MDSNQDVYTPGVAAARLKVDPRTLTRWADRGLIEVIVLPSGHRRYPRAAVDAIATSERVAS